MSGEVDNNLVRIGKDPRDVLETPELLDNILSFLNLEDLYVVRQVSQYWRSTSKLTLRRRLCAEAQGEREYGRPRIFNLFLREEESCRFQSRLLPNIPPAPIPSALDDETEIYIGMPYLDNVPGIPKSLPLLLRTLLTFEWPSRIQRLTLCSQALSVQEWNLVGVYLLNCFKSLRHLVVELDSRAEISPEWRKDMLVVADPTSVVSQLKYLMIRYAHNNQHFELQDRLLDLAFLDNCPTLQSLHLNYIKSGKTLCTSTSSFSTICKFGESSDSSPNQSVSCSIRIPHDFVANDHHIIELNAHLKALKPTELKLTGEMTDYPAELPSEATSNLASLSLGARFDANAEWIISSLSRLEVLSGITSLSLTYAQFWIQESPPLPKLTALASTTSTPTAHQRNSLLNVASLTINWLQGDCLCHAQARAQESRFFGFYNIWPTPLGRQTLQMWEQAAGFLPNVKVLNVTAACQCFIEHVHRFQRLRHLVMGLRSGSSNSAKLFKEQVRMLKELRTLTVCFNDEPLVEDVRKLQFLVQVMALAPKLQVVQVCYPAPDGERMPDLEATIRRNVPEFSRLELVICRTEEEDVEYPSLESLDAILQ